MAASGRSSILKVAGHYPRNRTRAAHSGFYCDSTMFSNPAALFASLLFGAIGLGVFMYGKKMVLYKPMVIGFVLILMVYPYFVPQTWLIYTIGCALLLGAVCPPRLTTHLEGNSCPATF